MKRDHEKCNSQRGESRHWGIMYGPYASMLIRDRIPCMHEVELSTLLFDGLCAKRIRNQQLKTCVWVGVTKKNEIKLTNNDFW